MLPPVRRNGHSLRSIRFGEIALATLTSITIGASLIGAMAKATTAFSTPLVPICRRSTQIPANWLKALATAVALIFTRDWERSLATFLLLIHLLPPSIKIFLLLVPECRRPWMLPLVIFGRLT